MFSEHQTEPHCLLSACSPLPFLSLLSRPHWSDTENVIPPPCFLSSDATRTAAKKQNRRRKSHSPLGQIFHFTMTQETSSRGKHANHYPGHPVPGAHPGTQTASKDSPSPRRLQLDHTQHLLGPLKFLMLYSSPVKSDSLG